MLVVNIRKLQKGETVLIRITDGEEVEAIYDHLTISNNVVVYIGDVKSVFYCTELVKRIPNTQSPK